MVILNRLYFSNYCLQVQGGPKDGRRGSGRVIHSYAASDPHVLGLIKRAAVGGAEYYRMVATINGHMGSREGRCVVSKGLRDTDDGDEPWKLSPNRLVTPRGSAHAQQ
jgi:hypothetical protein